MSKDLKNLIEANIITAEKEKQFSGYFDHNTIEYINEKLLELKELAERTL